MGSPLLYYDGSSNNHHWMASGSFVAQSARTDRFNGHFNESGLNNGTAVESSHSFTNLMRYNTPATPTSPFGRTRLPPYAATYGDLGSASAGGWSNVSPPFDSTGK